MSVRGLSDGWAHRYGHPLYLSETFVDLSRIAGTCYRAANWCVGQTQGHANRANRYHRHGQVKGIYLYPLYSNFRPSHLVPDIRIDLLSNLAQ